MDGDALVSWFRANARDLPWRADVRDPYRVWVSEVMLQQTRVETALRYYARFLERFPTLDALATASEADVMKAWEGLGYYRRARLLHAGAKALAGRPFPRTTAALRDVPGIGPYTAGAISSLAFGERAAAVDGNVLRVVARQRKLSSPTVKEASSFVLRHQPASAPGAFNEALMELGATVCTPRAPECGACPVAGTCRAPGDRLPAPKEKPAPRTMRVSLAIARRGPKLLLEKRDAGLLAGTWGLPWIEGGREELAARVEAMVGAPARLSPEPELRGKHRFTHRTWEMDAYTVETDGRGGEWRAPDDVALGAAHRRLLTSKRR